jgi:hypothetical protein
MNKELIKYVMEKANECYADDFPIRNIEIWINEFFDQYQPERSKREDFYPEDHIWCGCGECGECSCKRCGALNSMET